MESEPQIIGSPAIRAGLGHDTHRLVHGGPLRLGGVEIPFDQHLDGHSDADVLLHAVTDALLGAARLGDIGELFPNNAAENKDRDSAEMLRIAYDKVQASLWRVVNLDCIVFAERPRLSGYKEKIAAVIADILSIPPECVGVKGKTGEKVGPIGRGEAISAECVVLLHRP